MNRRDFIEWMERDAQLYGALPEIGAPAFDSGIPEADIHELVESVSTGYDIQTFADRYAKEQMRDIERDLKGAWMAGYDRLDIYLEGHALARPPPDDMSLPDRTTVPRYDGQPRDDPDGYTYEYSYDLTSVPDAVIRAALDGELPEDS